MKRLKHILSLLVLLLFTALSQAAETRIVGEVLSAATGEPVGNVSVFFKGTKVGTTTDENGLFYLHVDLMKEAKLVVSCIGYKTQSFTVQPGQDAGLAVVLEEKRHQLEELVVLPGANPALPLLDSVRAHRRENMPAETLPNGRLEQEYFLSNITAKTLKRRLWKSLESGMQLQEDSTYILPLPEALYSTLAVPIPDHLNFYQTTIPFGSLSMLSPMVASAGGYYRFFLTDSLESPKRYRVDFLPRNSFDPLFKGTFTIDSATYALTDITASIPRDANVNFLTSLHYDATYSPGELDEERMSAVLDLAVRTDSSHTFPALLVKQRFEKGEGLKGLETPQGQLFGDVQKGSDWFGAAPADSSQLGLLRFATWLAWLVHTGYARTGTPIDIGNVSELIRLNRYETLHLGLPFRTNEQLFPHVSLEGYIGYGIRDRGVKYKVQAQVLLPTQRRHVLGAYWWDRYVLSEVSTFDELMRENSWVPDNMRFVPYLVSDLIYRNRRYGTPDPTAVRKRELRVWTENDWCDSEGAKPAVETKLAIQAGRLGYGNPCEYHYYDMPSFRFNSVTATVRLGWHERTVDLYLTRKHLYSTYPTLFLGAEMGSWTPDGESHYRMYGKLNLLLRHNASLGMGGTLNYTFGAGLVLGNVPNALLAVMNGSTSYVYSSTRFSLMDNHLLYTNKYVQLQADWNGQGILFNRIPGIRYLRLRELAELKVAYYGQPYAEVGVGIGNILRMFDVYSVWRLTPAGDEVMPRWAVKFRFNLGL